MGKGTNYVKKPTLLDAIVHSGKLLKHTRDIIKNEKVFDPKRDFQNRLLLKVYDTALDINSKAYTANELRTDTNPRIAAERSRRTDWTQAIRASVPVWRKARIVALSAVWMIS